MQLNPTRLIVNRNRRLGVTEAQEAKVRKYLKTKLLQRCKERAKVSRQQTLYNKRTNCQEITPTQLLEEETPLQDTILEGSFLQSLSDKEYEEWMVALEKMLQEDLVAEQQESDQRAIESKALEELEFERQLLERYEMFIER